MLGRRDLDWICGVLGLTEGEITSVTANPHSGRNNDTYILTTTRGPALYRVAGRGTERFCNREREASAYRKLAGQGLTDELLGCDPVSGAKLTVYYPGARTCNPRDRQDRAAAMALLRRFHGQRVELEGRAEPYRRLAEYVRIAEGAGADPLRQSDFRKALQGVNALRGALDWPEDRLCPVHADAQAGNFLFKPDGMALLIDLEFASMGCFYGDLADFCLSGGFSEEERRELLRDYLLREPVEEEQQRLRAHCACAALIWSAWASYKAHLERNRSSMYEEYRDRSVSYALKCLDL